MILYNPEKVEHHVVPFHDEKVEKKDRGLSTAELLKISGEQKREDA